MTLPHKAIFFTDTNGGSPVVGYLRGLPKHDRQKVVQRIALLEEKGLKMPFQYCKKLVGTELWELKTKYRTNEHRILFFYNGKNPILVHGFQKKTEDTPTAEIRIAERRMSEWKLRRGI